MSWVRIRHERKYEFDPKTYLFVFSPTRFPVWSLWSSLPRRKQPGCVHQQPLLKKSLPAPQTQAADTRVPFLPSRWGRTPAAPGSRCVHRTVAEFELNAAGEQMTREPRSICARGSRARAELCARARPTHTPETQEGVYLSADYRCVVCCVGSKTLLFF